MKKVFLLGSLLVLAGCSSFSFHTNLDPSNFQNYYKPSAATEVTDEDLAGKNYKSIGSVKGLSCQLNEDDHIANEADARTEARLAAADLGANGIKFGQCVRVEDTPACKVSITCFANALVIGDEKESE